MTNYYLIENIQIIDVPSGIVLIPQDKPVKIKYCVFRNIASNIVPTGILDVVLSSSSFVIEDFLAESCEIVQEFLPLISVSSSSKTSPIDIKGFSIAKCSSIKTTKMHKSLYACGKISFEDVNCTQKCNEYDSSMSLIFSSDSNSLKNVHISECFAVRQICFYCNCPKIDATNMQFTRNDMNSDSTGLIHVSDSTMNIYDSNFEVNANRRLFQTDNGYIKLY